MDVVLHGVSAEGERWTLNSEDTPLGPGVSLEVRTPGGRRRFGRTGSSTPLRPGKVLEGDLACGERGEPSTLVLKLRADVRAVVVHLSDGTREDLLVADDPRRRCLRWSVLLYPRHLDVRRIDVYDAAGAALHDAALAQGAT
ncbi:hypothetical protein [Kineococcus sp. SYSU DK005]|uniref:hypothetical protein n=1 Tax=Kineococcus sp. SYSU DK005 TaxID=3383126 RepID=UPI003D7E34B4